MNQRLTGELVSRGRGAFPPGTPGALPEGRRRAEEADHLSMLNALLASRAGQDIWIFAYGSLIWKPGFEHVERRIATATGWQRSFCLGPDRWVRGCLERPGLMLVLDKGISCTGVAYRLPPEDKENQLLSIVKREVIFVPHSFPPLWINVWTDQGTVPAVTFAMDRSSKGYVSGLTSDEIAAMLATASGPAGTMAEYLAQTVEHLESDGIHDPYLWDLQERVAEKLEALPR